MLWHILKYYMCFVVAVYFKRYKVKNGRYLKVKGPVIIAMNHPNAFMDPIAFTTLIYPPQVRYLARGDAFKKGIVSSLLESMGIIPIFRIQDGGREGLKKNDETYDRVNELLKQNQKIIIFAEGLCIQERRLRPLKKGVPRMVFGAMDAYDLKDLTVVPVGVNYTNPSQFRSTLFCNIGKPIKIADYMPSYKEAPAKTMNQFLADLAPKMKELIVNIDDKKSEQIIEHLEIIYKPEFFAKEKLNLNDPESDFVFSTKIAETINDAEKNQPETIRALEEKTSRYIHALNQYKIKNWLLLPQNQWQINFPVFALRCLAIIITLPLYLRGLAGSYIPYALTGLITRKKVRLIEFKASFSLGIGAIAFLLFGILQFFIAKALAPHIWWALLVLFVTVLTGLFCLYLSPFRKKTWGIYRIIKLKSSQPSVYEALVKQREEIIRDFEALG